MASNYTDSFEGDPYFIKKGEQLSAAGVNAALNTREKVANKTDAIDSNNSSSSAQYPSVKAVNAALEAVNTSLQKAVDDSVQAVNTSLQAVNTSLETLGTQKQDKLSTEQLSLLNSISSTLSALSFFPRGTILPFSTTAWDEASAAFKMIWKICDGQNGTINLVGKFIRGGAYAQYGQTGGTDTAEVLYHTHEVTDNGHGHSVTDPGHNHNVAFFRGLGGPTNIYGLSWSKDSVSMQTEHAGSAVIQPAATGISIVGNTTGVSVKATGSATADNRPAFYTLMFIQKIAA